MVRREEWGEQPRVRLGQAAETGFGQEEFCNERVVNISSSGMLCMDDRRTDAYARIEMVMVSEADKNEEPIRPGGIVLRCTVKGSCYELAVRFSALIPNDEDNLAPLMGVFIKAFSTLFPFKSK